MTRDATTPRWLTDTEMRAWLGLLGVSSLLDRRIDQHLRDSAGLSHVQWEVLTRLTAAPAGEARMTELAAAAFTTKSGLSYQISRLEKAGLVRRRTVAGDERGIRAVITAAGRRKVAANAPQHVAVVREIFFDALTAEQVQVLGDTFAEVSDRLGHTRPV